MRYHCDVSFCFRICIWLFICDGYEFIFYRRAEQKKMEPLVTVINQIIKIFILVFLLKLSLPQKPIQNNFSNNFSTFAEELPVADIS